MVALVVARRTRGRIRWWPGWSNGWWKWPGHPWGHFYVELRDGTTIHWHDLEPEELPPWRQLWFEGRLVRSRPRWWKPAGRVGETGSDREARPLEV